MENASKALIIVGAILVSILIIAIGMYIYSSSTGSVEDAIAGMKVHEIEAFNKNWSSYEGKQSGSQIKTLINKLAANAQTFEEEEEKIIDLTCYLNDPTGGGSPNKKENIFEDIASKDVPKYRKELNSLYAQIQTKHTYYVVLDYKDTALIRKIHICYSEDQKNDVIANLGS